MGPPASIVAGLQAGNEETQATLARQLGLTHFAPSQNYRNCDIRADAPKLDERGGTSVLQIKCKNDVEVIALRDHGGISEVLASRHLYAASHRWRIEFASLIGPSVQQVVIHNAATSPNAREGSYFLVLRLADKELTVLFSALETSSSAPRDGKTYLQESTFSTVPASGTRMGEIGEHATVQTGERTYAIRRSFCWSESLLAFVEVAVPNVQPRK